MHTTTEMINGLQSEKNESPVRRDSFYEFIIAVLFTALLVWVGYYLFNPSTLPIRQVRIEGEFRHLSTGALQELVKNKVTGGFFNIDVTAIRNTLLTDPWVRDVSVHRVWPDSVQVFVTEQIAVARWNDNGLLNRTSELFVPDRATFPEGLPLLDGPEGSEALMLEKYYFIREQLQPLAMEISLLKLDERRAWMFESGDGLLVVIGREDLDERIARFARLIPESLGEKIHAAEMIDMRYPNGFAVRWKQGEAEIRPESGAL